jgi:Restriction alleviation protein Lar
MSELLPCPFCGGEVESKIAYTASMIDCKNEKCIMIGCLMDNEPWVDEIEKKWNEQKNVYFGENQHLSKQYNDLADRLKKSQDDNERLCKILIELGFENRIEVE